MCLENANIFNSLSLRANSFIRLDSVSFKVLCKGGVQSVGDLSLCFSDLHPGRGQRDGERKYNISDGREG